MDYVSKVIPVSVFEKLAGVPRLDIDTVYFHNDPETQKGSTEIRFKGSVYHMTRTGSHCDLAGPTSAGIDELVAFINNTPVQVTEENNGNVQPEEKVMQLFGYLQEFDVPANEARETRYNHFRESYPEIIEELEEQRNKERTFYGLPVEERARDFLRWLQKKGLVILPDGDVFVITKGEFQLRSVIYRLLENEERGGIFFYQLYQVGVDKFKLVPISEMFTGAGKPVLRCYNLGSVAFLPSAITAYVE